MANVVPRRPLFEIKQAIQAFEDREFQMSRLADRRWDILRVIEELGESLQALEEACIPPPGGWNRDHRLPTDAHLILRLFNRDDGEPDYKRAADFDWQELTSKACRIHSDAEHGRMIALDTAAEFAGAVGFCVRQLVETIRVEEEEADA